MSRMPRPTGPVGLYDPTYEHDACGVAFVARLSGEPTHETVQRAIMALENLEHRGAAGADPNTGDGAGILLQMPDELMRGLVGQDLPPPGAYGVCVCFLPTDEDAPRRVRGAARARRSRPRASASSAGATSRSTRTTSASPPTSTRPTSSSSWWRPRAPLQDDQDAFERKLYVIRRMAELAAGPELVIPSFSQPHRRLQGDADRAAAARLLPRPAGHADQVGARARPLALLHQHLPELGAGAPVPDDRPQRRDQHAARQRQLDARARVPARLRAVRRRPAEDPPDRAPRRLGLGDVRQRARAAHARRPQRPARGDDDDPGGLRGPGRHARGPQGLLRLPLLSHGAVGRPGGGRLHRRPRDRRHARPQRPAPRPLAGDQGRLGGARLRDRRDRRAARERASARAACSPATSSWSTSSAAASSRTARSSARSPRASPTASGSSAASTTSPTCPTASPPTARTSRCAQLQLAFGYTQEDLKVLLAPTAAKGEEPIGSMGNDLSLAVLSDSHPPLFSYFKQLFAQVTNPPIDPIREAIVMSVSTGVGSERNLLDETPEHASQLGDGDADPAQPRAREAAPGRLRDLPRPHARHHVADRRGPRGHGEGARPPVRRGRPGARRGRQRADPVRPRGRARAGRHARAAGRRRRPPPPRARGHAAAGRPRARVRRAARGPSLRDADRLRRQRHQPVRDVRLARRAGARRQGRRRRRCRDRRDERRQGHRQGPAQDDLQDGDLDDPVLQRRADLRGRRPGRAT